MFSQLAPQTLFCPTRRRHRWAAGLRMTALAAALAVIHFVALGSELRVNPSPPATTLKNMNLEQLGEVEVTTYSKAPTQLWNTPSAIYVITHEQILRSGATNIADALRLAPGVEVGRMSSDFWAVGIRGLQNNFSKSVLVLIDGRNVYTPLFAGVYWDVQDMPLDNIDRIEVIRGPGATMWGPNAANGVINIVTKNSADTQGFFADGLAGSEDHTLDDAQFGGSNGDLHYRVLGRGFERRHEYNPDGPEIDSWHQERLSFRGDRMAGDNAFLAEGDVYKGTAPHITALGNSNDQTSGGDVNLRWEHDFTDQKGLYVQAYFDRTLRTHTAEVDESRDTIDMDFMQHFMAGHANLISYGGTLRWSPWLTVPEDLLVPPGGTDHEHVGFVQDEIRLKNSLRFTAGAKEENNNYSGWDFEPSGRLLWSPGNEQALWTAVTREVTTPSDIEENFRLQASAGTVVLQVLGNHNFQSEQVTGYEIGYRRMMAQRLLVNLAGYWNQYSRLQSFSAPAISTTGGYTYIKYLYTNQISGSASGFEIGTEAQIEAWWRLNTNYSYLNSDFAANGATSNISSTGSVQTYDESSPKHTVTAQSLFDLPGGIQFDQMYRFVSALPAQEVRAYQTMDSHLQKTLGRGFAVELVGQNLFQNSHAEWGTGNPGQQPLGIYRAGYARVIFHSGK